MNLNQNALVALTSVRRIAHRTHGRSQGSTTRLMSPSDFGEILKPFVFLDLFDHEGEPFNAPLHPHSGIATLSYVAEDAVSNIHPHHRTGVPPAVRVYALPPPR